MTSVKCPQCGLTNWLSAGECKRCKFVFGTNQAEFQAAASFGGQNYAGSEPTAHQYSSPPPNFPPPSNGYSDSNYGQNDGYQTHQPPNYQYGKPSDVKSGLAIASMVLGILGFVTSIILVGVIFSLIGLILGIVALVKANKKPHIYGGTGFAIAGVVLSALIVLFIPIIAAIAIPNLLAARRAANEGSAISRLRTLYGAEQTYMATAGKGSCGEFNDLVSSNLVDSKFGKGEYNGYKFIIVKVPVANGGCEMHATPMSSSSGTRSFYISTNEGLLRAAIKNGRQADNTAPSIDGGETEYSNQPAKIATR